MTATPNGQYKPDRSDAALARRAVAVVRDQSHECLEVLRVLLSAARDGAPAVQTEVAWQMRDYGLDPVELGGHSPATLAARRSGRGGGRSLLLWAHPDGPPFRSADGWSMPPFTGEVRDGLIYGWTVADDLSGVAALLVMPRILRILNADLAGDLVLVSAPTWEPKHGLRAALEAGFTADAGLCLRPPTTGAGLTEITALMQGETEATPESAFYGTLAGAMLDVTGTAPGFDPPGPLTDAIDTSFLTDPLLLLGIGPRAGEMVRARGVDEWLDIEEYLHLIAVVALTAVRWCTGEPR